MLQGAMTAKIQGTNYTTSQSPCCYIIIMTRLQGWWMMHNGEGSILTRILPLQLLGMYLMTIFSVMPTRMRILFLAIWLKADSGRNFTSLERFLNMDRKQIINLVSDLNQVKFNTPIILAIIDKLDEKMKKAKIDLLK